MLEFNQTKTNDDGHDAQGAQPLHQRAFIVSTRPPKKPLSGGMAPAVREASREYDEVIWYALGSEGDKTAMRKSFDASSNTPDSKPVPVQRYEVEGFNVRQVQLTKDNWTAHYDEFCNRWIWPACHDLLQFAKKRLSIWDIQGNQTVNDLIARDMAFELAQEGDKTSPIMIQDYHHFKLAMYLRHYDVENPIIFFNHTPLPTIETLSKMGRKERQEFTDMMKSLLNCDSVQFQTEETARTFLKIVGYDNPPSIGMYESVVIPVQEEGKPDRFVRVGHAPISINADKVFNVSRSPEPLVAQHSQWLEDQMVAPYVLLNFERCDYTKGIKERAEAFIQLMEVRPDLRGKVQLVLQAEPTRTDIHEYRQYAEDVKDLVNNINSDERLKLAGKDPVIFLNANIPNDDLLKIMNRSKTLFADENGDIVDASTYENTSTLQKIEQVRICAVTPLKDGMNLTSKEAAVAGMRVLLSTGAGAAAELEADGKGAIVYRPSENGNPAALVKGLIKVIDMTQEEAAERAKLLLEIVRGNTIQRWGRYMKDESNIILDARENPKAMPGVARMPEYEFQQ